MKIDQFKTEINKRRRAGGWYTFAGKVEGKEIVLKGYKTWLQIFRVDGIDYSNICDCSVKQFNADLLAPFE